MYIPGVFCDSDAIVSKGKSSPVSVGRLRRVALDRQGLLKSAPFGRGKNATARAIEALGYVQIDTISVVMRAHHHVLATRVPNYEPGHLDRLQREGRVFEYWAHAAAYLPMRDYRFALPIMQRHRNNEDRWVRSRDEKLMADVLDRVRIDGPLQSRDFEHPEGKKGSGWWDWKPAKKALDQLFMRGDLMISGRSGFQKTYDLTERVLPAEVATAMPTEAEYAAYLVDTVLRSHGFATQKSFTHLRRGASTRLAVKAVLDERVAEGLVTELRLPDSGVWYALTEVLDSRAPPAAAEVRILSPFDNAIILRHRTESLYDFDYQLECYVTEKLRKFGYFCLPILYRDQIIGRTDCKAHRKSGELEVRRLFIECPERIDEQFPGAMARALHRFAGANGCSDILLGDVAPSNRYADLRQAIEATQ